MIADQERRPKDGLSKVPPASMKTGVILTVIAWLLTRFAVGADWPAARDPFAFHPLLWKHWDSFAYLKMAAHGRTFGRCGSPGFPETLFTRYTHETWCGTAGWLPGYPWLITSAHWLGVPLLDAGVIISWIATAAAIFIVWFGWGRHLSAGRSLAVLLLFGVFPGAVYNFGIFPTSMGLALLTGAILAATRKRFVIATGLLTCAGLTYPTAWFAAVGLAVGLIVIAIPEGLAKVVQRALWGLAGLASIVVLGVIDQISFGSPGAFFLFDQQAVGSVFSVGDYMRELFISRDTIQQVRMGRAAAPLLSFQVFMTFVLSGTAAVVAGIGVFRRKWEAAQVYPAMVGIAVVAGLAFTDSSTWNRSVVLAAPCVVALRRLPAPILWALVGIVGITTALISRSFFDNRFI